MTRSPESVPSRLEISSVMPSAKYASSDLPRFSNGRTASEGSVSAAGEPDAAPAAPGMRCEYQYQLDDPRRRRVAAAPIAIHVDFGEPATFRAGIVPVYGVVAALGVTAASSCASISAADCGRSAACFSSARMMSAERSGGTDFLLLSSGSGSSIACAASIAWGERALKICCPDSISYATAATE